MLFQVDSLPFDDEIDVPLVYVTSHDLYSRFQTKALHWSRLAGIIPAGRHVVFMF